MQASLFVEAIEVQTKAEILANNIFEELFRSWRYLQNLQTL